MLSMKKMALYFGIVIRRIKWEEMASCQLCGEELY